MLIEATTQTTLGNVYILTGDDDLHVGAGVTIQSTYNDPATHTGADAVIAWVGTHTITVDGTIIGEDEAINLVGCVTAQTVVINAGGQLISGGDGVVEDADGVILDGAGSTLSNAGSIDAWGSAVSAIVLDNSTMTVSNSGTMYGRLNGVWHKFGNGTLNFTNTGTVESLGHSFLGGASIDNVTNRGSMIGGVDLGAGNDSYDGRGGSVTGSILGGDGDDRFRPGNAADTINGGAGIDTLDFSGVLVGLVVNLTIPSQNMGAPVVGDSYTGIENIIGTGYADRLVGNTADNRLFGAGKIDTLAGDAGNDVIIGGNGKDRTYGGTGSDQFQFFDRGDLGDLIYDFSSPQDQIAMEGSGFGYGSYAGGIAANTFVTSTTNAAQDADDRFIFRTGDKTLWFDADGTGWRAAVLVADLQTGATMTFADVQII